MSRLRAIARPRFRLLLMAVVALASMLTAGVVWAESSAQGDGCYTWNRDLASGATGDDVKQLQIRVFGYPEYGKQLAVDGQFGPATTAAVKRFQQAYGLSQTGKGDAATYAKFYELQDDDCTPIHFTYAELNDCNSDWSGGKVSAAEAKANALRVMWGLEAMRHALGDKPITVTSGFRSVQCNNNAGGASDSQHLYGRSADLGAGPHSLCTLAKEARSHGFMGIFGPGYDGHDDHTHADIRSTQAWSAPDCGVRKMAPGAVKHP